MILRVWRYGLAASVVLALALLGVTDESGPWAQGQPPCTVTVKPGESIQRAIDAAQEGAVVCLTTGTWKENIDIKKSLTIQGRGPTQTIIKKNSGPLIFIKGDITVRIENLAITEAQGMPFYAHGLYIRGKAKVTLFNLLFSKNQGSGLTVKDSAQVRLIMTTISHNGTFGLSVEDLALAEVQSSVIEGNGVDEGCHSPHKRLLCHGIVLSENSSLSLIEAKILGSADWGLTAILKSCKYSDLQVSIGGFTGQVSFQGMNKIEGNNTSGYLNGMGNPGNHPWNRPDVPDGQVCLP